MANPQSPLAALADSQELLTLVINSQGDSGNQPSRPENPSGATEMSTANSISEEAGASSLPIILPEPTELGPTNRESSTSKVEDTTIKEVSYLDGNMFWVNSEILPKTWDSLNVSSFLWAPQDCRLCLAFLESWKRHDIPRSGGCESYTRNFKSLSREDAKDRLIDLRDFIEAATNIEHGGHGLFIIRDADLEGNNRNYSSNGRIVEYDDRGIGFYGRDYLEKSTIMKVQSVNWDLCYGEDNPYLRSLSPAPWRRICLLQGLNTIKPPVRDGKTVLLPFLADEDKTILWHLKGGQFFKPLLLDYKYRHEPFFGWSFSRWSTVLQFFWYRKVGPPAEQIMDAMAKINAEKIGDEVETIQWYIGSLYGQQQAQKIVYTVQAIQNDSEEKKELQYDGEHWTVLVLAPEGFYDGEPTSHEPLFYSPLYRLPTVMLQRAAEALEFMIKDWSEILTYIEELLGDQELIFSPREHDKLLEDDKSGSRSRMYFWVINSLITFRSIMDESAQVYLEFRGAVIPEFPQPEYSWEEQEIMAKADKTKENFEKLGTRADVIRGRATVLLSSLFNAISVAESHRSADITETIERLTQSTLDESRKSTRLGQNVMLLTYVSIFYLPLAFCTSLWATTSTFGFHNLIGVMVATGVATYVIAFNLKRISEFYQARRRKVVGSMLKDSNWEELGEGFKKSFSDDDSLGPSEWWIFIYFVRTFFKKSRSDGGGKKGDDGTTVKTVPDGHKTEDSTASDNIRKSGDGRTDRNENVPQQTAFKEVVGPADGSKVEGESSKGMSKQTIAPHKNNWFPLRRNRVPFSNYSKSKEPDIEGQKSRFDSGTDTGKGKGKDMARISDKEETEIEKGDGAIV